MVTTPLPDALPTALQVALLRIRSDHPFLGALALFATVSVSEKVKTAATDGQTLWFNPKFVAKQDTLRLCGLVAHELLHMGLQHCSRRGSRDSQLWNIAADIVVNGVLREQTNYALPRGAVECAELAQLSVEEVYEQFAFGHREVPRLALVDLLPDHDEPGAPQADPLVLQTHWRAAWHQATSLAYRMQMGLGSLGLGLTRECACATGPQLGWQELLWRFMVITPSDFGGYDRRFVHRKLYVEELVGDNVNIAICIDTSGSVGTDDLKRFMGEVRGIFDAYPQLRGQLFFGDTKLYGPHAVGADVALPTARGGGGTSFIPFFEWIDVHQAAQLAIYFTDGMGTFPAGPPNLPTLWVVSPGGLETGRFPFGDVARMGLV